MAEANWKDTLPDDLKASPALKDIADVGSLAKNYVEAQSMIGRSVRIPSKEAGEPDRKAFKDRMLEVGKDYGVVPLPGEGEDDTPFWKTLGYPEKPEGYEYKDKPPEGVVISEDDTAILRAAAHKAKLTPKQYKAVMAHVLEAQAAPVREHQTRMTQGNAKLKEEWGDAYDTRRAQVGALLEQYQAPDLVRNAFKSGAMDAGSTRWLWEVLSAFGGEPLEVTRSKFNTHGANETRAEMLERVTEIENRLKDMQPSHPDYQTLVQRRVQLMEKAYPEKVA
jgi:hypothetical protein